MAKTSGARAQRRGSTGFPNVQEGGQAQRGVWIVPDRLRYYSGTPEAQYVVSDFMRHQLYRS